MPVPREVRRRIGRLVRRDAMRAYGTGLILYIAATLWLVRIWPPGELRRLFWAAEPVVRADVAVMLVGIHTAVTVPVARMLLASRRLEIWRSLPLRPGFWRGTHALDLALLHAAFTGALIFAGLTRPSLATWLGVPALALAGPAMHVAAIALQHRRAASWGGIGIALGTLWLLARPMVPPAVAASVAVLAAGIAWHRLGAVFPEPSERAAIGMRRMGGPARAWTRLLLHVALRRHPRAIASLVLAQLALVALAAVAHAHVHHDPPAIASLVRVCCLLATVAGAALLPVAVRAIERDRPLLDALPLPPRTEWRGRVGLSLIGSTPGLVGLCAVTTMAVDPLRALAEATCACAWAAVEAERFTASAEAQRNVEVLPGKRAAALVVLAVVLVVLTGTCAVLLPWALASAWPGAPRLRDLRSTRGRRQSARQNDDHG